MSDIIHLLPDSVANQIAAGEVIQRPASVVKELMENALDATATNICVVVKNAGKTLVQVFDNGKGMSHTDARMAFERHATSKISHPNDLFNLRTMGFRGEALASIAAVAAVDLKTRQKDTDFGTFIETAASDIIKHEPVACAEGTTFLVKNLFFNVPARRKFLKSEETELRNIIVEFQRVALANAGISFELYNDTDKLFELPACNFKQRITQIFSKKNKNYANQLIAVAAETSIVKISGFVGNPQTASKAANQFFFVNGRFMRHPYLNKAVQSAYENMLQPDTQPNYFISFDVNPANIDVNIHPTKTEIKFEDEREIWVILMACVKESLGKFNFTPSIDFNTEGNINIPPYRQNNNAQMPRPSYNPDYNPFNTHSHNSNQHSSIKNWELLYEKNERSVSDRQADNQQQITVPTDENLSGFYLYKEKYLLTSVKSGLMIIDCQRAIERITYEKIILQLQLQQSAIQKVLFPETFAITTEEKPLFDEILPDLTAVGFEFEKENDNFYLISGIPSLLTETRNIPELLHNILAFTGENSIEKEIYEKIAIQMSKSYAKWSFSKLNSEEATTLAGSLFKCQNPNYAINGEKIIIIIPDEEIIKQFYFPT
ncbi:MAG: DNA mismatch repair endonuclease MutL [Prevotellaceae bacterium]|jgi:DNA mismatch repair protein MutL|nr:DNA mismatch repair endonuclease MutL [Prevotellaceae bacterium]